jgi:hypothetical protein
MVAGVTFGPGAVDEGGDGAWFCAFAAGRYQEASGSESHGAKREQSWRQWHVDSPSLNVCVSVALNNGLNSDRPEGQPLQARRATGIRRGHQLTFLGSLPFI